MQNTTLTRNIIKSIIPISRFNKGEANKIFKELEKDGPKIVVKNNVPTCVMITPKEYEEIIEKLDDYYLLLESISRISDSDENVSQEVLLKDLGITQAELNDTAVEIE